MSWHTNPLSSGGAGSNPVFVNHSVEIITINLTPFGSPRLRFCHPLVQRFSRSQSSSPDQFAPWMMLQFLQSLPALCWPPLQSSTAAANNPKGSQSLSAPFPPAADDLLFQIRLQSPAAVSLASAGRGSHQSLSTCPRRRVFR